MVVIFRFALLVILYLLSVACHNPINYSSPESRTDQSIFNQNHCSYPCWEGLYPGQSSQEDVNQIINQIEFIPISSLRVDVRGNKG